ncbi:snoRNA-binding rRNA-processing protein [Serendipita sp. 401]|nr:snoRNA-binding rRNA-processing protein [Serendipita sp. 401]KAG8835626.1 snoRNA-binding rRNA-processing protein [Serendipita sp. 400]KAG9054847.1 snoRNA-binding rRNA-processing protein [Serendipita sp. 407]
MPKQNKVPSGKQRHDPLHVEIDADERLQKYGNVTHPGKRKSAKKPDNEESETLLDSKTSRKILQLARDQQEELELKEELGVDVSEEKRVQTHYRDVALAESDDDEEGIQDAPSDEEVYEEIQIDEEDLTALDKFLPSDAVERKTLADIIFEKLQEAENEEQEPKVQIGKGAKPMRDPSKPPDPTAGLEPKVVEVYTKLGIFLSRYRSSSLPKAFKIIPSLSNWARILAITRPESWTPHAMRAATRILVSNLKPEQCRVFLEGVLLPAVRNDIAEHGKLNVQYFEALVKSVYKPGAFFKGILFPLCEGGCTLKEAAIVGSVLSRVSVPILHSAAALLRLSRMEYSGPNSLFIRVLLDKKYALPYKVVDGLVEHFIILSNTYKGRRDRGQSEKLPVLWHQSLLVFAQRYAADITPDQKNALLDVIRVNNHPQISLEVRRELINSVARGEPRDAMEVDSVR